MPHASPEPEKTQDEALGTTRFELRVEHACRVAAKISLMIFSLTVLGAVAVQSIRYNNINKGLAGLAVGAFAHLAWVGYRRSVATDLLSAVVREAHHDRGTEPTGT